MTMPVAGDCATFSRVPWNGAQLDMRNGQKGNLVTTNRNCLFSAAITEAIGPAGCREPEAAE